MVATSTCSRQPKLPSSKCLITLLGVEIFYELVHCFLVVKGTFSLFAISSASTRWLHPIHALLQLRRCLDFLQQLRICHGHVFFVAGRLNFGWSCFYWFLSWSLFLGLFLLWGYFGDVVLDGLHILLLLFLILLLCLLFFLFIILIRLI